MLFAWAGFVLAEWTFVFDANNSIWTRVRENDERVWHAKCVFECVGVVIFGQNIKNEAEQLDSSIQFASYLTQACMHSIHLLKVPQHNHKNAANHSSIFHAKLHTILASLCKMQLKCAREEKAGWANWYNKRVEAWVGAEENKKDRKREGGNT